MLLVGWPSGHGQQLIVLLPKGSGQFVINLIDRADEQPGILDLLYLLKQAGLLSLFLQLLSLLGPFGFRLKGPIVR